MTSKTTTTARSGDLVYVTHPAKYIGRVLADSEAHRPARTGPVWVKEIRTDRQTCFLAELRPDQYER